MEKITIFKSLTDTSLQSLISHRGGQIDFAGDGCLLGAHGVLGVREAEAEGAGTETVSGELMVERRAGGNTATIAAERAEVCVTRGGKDASRVHVTNAQIRLGIISGTYFTLCLKSADYTLFMNCAYWRYVALVLVLWRRRCRQRM